MIRKNHIVWAYDGVKKLSFGLSETQPVRLIRHYWPDKKTFWYDMHYSLELGILLSGKMRRQYREAQIDVAPGEVWLCNMWEPHGFRIIRSPCDIVFFEIYPPMLAATYFPESSKINWMAPFYADPRQRPQSPDIKTRRHLLDLAQRLRRLAKVAEPPLPLLLRLSLLEALLIVCNRWHPARAPTRASTDSLEMINKAIQKVFESEGKVTTQAAAKESGMNRNVFSQIFYRTMGVSYRQFGLRYRIRMVAEQLYTTTTPLKAIAQGWGFTDISHMHRCFTRHYGCTPSDYRKRHSSCNAF